MVRFQELLREPKIAYFSMEVGILNDMPTYSGGLGVLAGDTIRSSADLKLPFVAVTLLSRKGFFNQDIDENGRQIESPVSWEPSRFMTLLSEKVKVKIEFTNTKQNNLGMPLPKGKIKVFKSDTDGSLQFIGEDLIDHTPKDETIRLYLGDAFDLVGERKKTNSRAGERWSEESFEISLRNHKEEDVEVNVVERLWRYANWKIIDKSGEFTKKDVQAIEFKVPVPKDKEAKVSYTVRYWW